MPALGDYLSTICQRIFDLCAAEPLWTTKIKPRARLDRFGGQGKWPTTNPVRKDPVITWDFRVTAGVPNPSRPDVGITTVFATVKGATAPLNLSKQYTIEHRLTYPDLLQTNATYLETLLELILVRAGAQLVLVGNDGLPYVGGCLPVTSKYDENNTAGPNGSPALVQTLTHPVNVTVSSADILGA